MEGTTNIDDLPVSPQSEGNNIQLTTSETNVKIENTMNDMLEQREAEIAPQSRDAEPGSFDKNMNNNFVSGVQKAAASGALELQSRDVPQNQTHLTQDPVIQPSFIPDKKQHQDYIENNEHREQIMKQHKEKQQTEENYDIMFNNLQTPILLAVLYFIFQLPIVKQTTFRLLPSLFKKDGTSNLNGYIVHSVSFACVYQSLIMTLNYFSI